MAINKNHEFEELGGVKCAIVEKNASKESVAFLKDLLETNNFEVVVVPSPPPKAAPPPKPADQQIQMHRFNLNRHPTSSTSACTRNIYRWRNQSCI